MPDGSRNDPEERSAEVWPEVPKPPELPEAPVLKPNLPPLERARKATEKEENARQLGLAYVLPTALAAPVIVLTLLGWWLDEKYDQSPIFTLAGALLGFVSGFINMIRIAGKLDR